MRRWAWLASAARASRSAASWRLAASRPATRAISSARSGPSISAPSWRRSRARSLSRSARSRRISLAGDGEVGAQAGLGDRLRRGLAGPRAGSAAVLGLAAPGGLEVLADAVGVDQPGGHPGGGGDRGRGDRCPGGFEGVHGGQGALALVVAGLWRGRPAWPGRGWWRRSCRLRGAGGDVGQRQGAGGAGAAQDPAGFLDLGALGGVQLGQSCGASCSATAVNASISAVRLAST